MSLIDNIEKVALTTTLPSDLILGTYEGSISVAAPGATVLFPTMTTNSNTFATGINEKTLFQGIFSVDGGTTWSDFNSSTPVQLGSWLNLQTQLAYAKINAGSFTVIAENWSRTSDGTNFSGSAYTFMYKVVLFAKMTQGDVEPQAFLQPRTFNSAYNYQKIYRENVYNFVFPVGTSLLILNHNLGYVPKIRMFVDNFSNASDTSALYDFGYFVSQFPKYQVYLDTTTFNVYVDNSLGIAPMTGTFYTRMYYRDSELQT